MDDPRALYDEIADALVAENPDVQLGRAFKEWVQVPADHMEQWPQLADESLRLRAD